MNFSFAGCGFLGIYHVGVASCLKQHAPQLLQDCHFSGASAGAILACCLISDCCLGDCTSFVLRLATKARSRSLGPLHPSFNVVQIMQEALREFLPENAHEIATGRLHISLTRVSDRENVMVSEFSSKEELIQALMCSAFVPLYSGLVPPSFRRVRYVDGGLSDNIPILNKETITVSPFAGESDICPTDNSANFIHVHLANTSMQCSMGNLYRMSRALFPPKPEILSDMCKQGFEDCSRFLRRNNLLSCVRHLSVRSFIIPVQVPERDIEVLISNQRACDVDVESNEEDCQECKKKVQIALLHNLPPAVVSALQLACDSVNKGVTAYIHRHRSLRLMSYIVTPWVLPLDIAYNFTLRFLQYLPSLPHDVHHCCRELREVCRAVQVHLQHQRKRYTARFSCQLAITEVNFNNAQRSASGLSGQNEPQPQHPLPTVRNLNIGFAVDFDTHVQDTAKSQHKLEGKLDHFKISQIQLQSDRLEQNTSVQTDPKHVSSAGFNVPCTQIFDTFDQCLRVSNQMDSVLAYYYRDENNRQCINFQEIFSLDNTELNIPSPETEQGSGTLENISELSWDSLADVQPDFQTDLEEFIETTMAISSDQEKEQ